MLPEQLGYITVLVTLVGISFYIRDISYGNTRPHLVSWFFWGLAPLIGTCLQLKAGAGLSVLPVFAAGLAGVLVFTAGIIKRTGYWKISKLDIACGVFSLCSLILWIVTRNTDIAIVFAILADGVAYIPTLMKAWKSPETESASGYLPGIFNNTLGLLIITNWDFSIYSFSLYFIVINIITVIFIHRKKIILWYTR